MSFDISPELECFTVEAGLESSGFGWSLQNLWSRSCDHPSIKTLFEAIEYHGGNMTKIRERCRENSITFSQYKLNYKNWENVPDIIHLLKRKTNLKQALTKYKQVQVEKRKRCTRCPYRFVNITNYLFMGNSYQMRCMNLGVRREWKVLQDEVWGNFTPVLKYFNTSNLTENKDDDWEIWQTWAALR